MDLFKRLENYVAKTGVIFEQTHRFNTWKNFGLPDVRGFCPHLRTVRMAEGDSLDIDITHPWTAHDLMHILFYDFATYHLGKDCWKDESRFLEIHLASEAFAVWALDYGCLINTEGKSLTIDLNRTQFEEFAKHGWTLSDPLSFEFCQALTLTYLDGQPRPFLKTFKEPITELETQYQVWAGHEVRYSAKQRLYAQMWLNNLMNRSPGTSEAIVENSAIEEAVFELGDLIINGSDKEWDSWIQTAKGFSKITNYFKDLPKYTSPENFDYRFNDFSAVFQKKRVQDLENATVPSGSSLFLFYQLLSTTKPEDHTASALKIFENLSSQANSGEIPQGIWDKARDSILKIPFPTRSPDEKHLSVFFLP